MTHVKLGDQNEFVRKINDLRFEKYRTYDCGCDWFITSNKFGNLKKDLTTEFG